MTLHKSYVSLDSLMPKHVGQSFAYACLSGIMLGCAFPPMPFGFLAFFAFIPVFLILEAESSRQKRSIVRYLYCTFFLYQGIANWWVGSWQRKRSFLDNCRLGFANRSSILFDVAIHCILLYQTTHGICICLWISSMFVCSL